MKYEYLLDCDLQPMPGDFVSQTTRPYEIVDGEMVIGLNWYHAVYLWFVRRAYNGNQCTHCHAHIRYAVALRNQETGQIEIVGEQCAERLERGLDAAAWRQLKIAREIKQSKKNERYYYSTEVEPDFWNIPKAERPAFVSLSKFKAPRMRMERWFMMVWGEQRFEVMENLDKLDALIAKYRHGRTSPALPAVDTSPVAPR